MTFQKIDWADSDIERITIEYDQALFYIFNDSLQKKLIIRCTGFAGITNLCMWDDTSIESAELILMVKENDEFLNKVYSLYDASLDYGNRSLHNHFWKLSITLSNNNTFSVYCQNVEVLEETDKSPY